MSFCVRLWTLTSLNESPSEKEGKYSTNRRFSQIGQPSMKVPPKRKGNDFDLFVVGFGLFPSMKVPPKRKGNSTPQLTLPVALSLNESPSEKEGKCCRKQE